MSQANPLILDMWPHLSGLQSSMGKEKPLKVFKTEGIESRKSITQTIKKSGEAILGMERQPGVTP